MTEQGWVEPVSGQPGLVEEGQAVQAGAGAIQGTITSAPPGDVAEAPEQIQTDQATAYEQNSP